MLVPITTSDFSLKLLRSIIGSEHKASQKRKNLKVERPHHVRDHPSSCRACSGLGCTVRELLELPKGRCKCPYCHMHSTLKLFSLQRPPCFSQGNSLRWRSAELLKRRLSSGPSSPSLAELARMRRAEMYKGRNRELFMYTSAVVSSAFLAKDPKIASLTAYSQIFVTIGVTYAAVPLYRMFCSATGFAGTPNTGNGKFAAERLIPVKDSHRIRVRFNSDVSDALPWTFTPQQKYIDVLPGGRRPWRFIKRRITRIRILLGSLLIMLRRIRYACAIDAFCDVYDMVSSARTLRRWSVFVSRSRNF